MSTPNAGSKIAEAVRDSDESRENLVGGFGSLVLSVNLGGIESNDPAASL
jgi:hypothetical protein